MRFHFDIHILVRLYVLCQALGGIASYSKMTDFDFTFINVILHSQKGFLGGDVSKNDAIFWYTVAGSFHLVSLFMLWFSGTKTFNVFTPLTKRITSSIDPLYFIMVWAVCEGLATLGIIPLSAGTSFTTTMLSAYVLILSMSCIGHATLFLFSAKQNVEWHLMTSILVSIALLLLPYCMLISTGRLINPRSIEGLDFMTFFLSGNTFFQIIPILHLHYTLSALFDLQRKICVLPILEKDAMNQNKREASFRQLLPAMFPKTPLQTNTNTNI